MISLYIPGNSLIHRIPAGWKLLGLALLSLGLFLVPPSYPAALGFLALPVLLYALACLSLRWLLLDIFRLLPLLVFMVITQLIFLDPMSAAANTSRVIAMILAAQVFTRTTKVDGVISTTQQIFGPLRKFGVNPEKIGLAVALVLASVGTLAGVVTQVRDAQKSRGVRIAPWAWVLPVLVLTLKHADDVGDALAARGMD